MLGESSYSIRKHLFLWVGLVLVLFFAHKNIFLHQQLISEDSFVFFQTTYNESIISSVAESYAGYYHVLPMLLAEMLWLLPFRLIPIVNHLLSLGISTALLSWFYSPSCRPIILNDGFRLLAVVVFSLLPFQPNLGMLLGLHWYLSIFVGFLLLGDPPDGGIRVLFLSFLLVLAALSSPSCVIWLPLAIWRYFSDRNQVTRFLWLAFAVAMACHVLVIVFLLKPASGQTEYASVLTATLACLKLLWVELFGQSLFGDLFIQTRVAPFLPFIGFFVVGLTFLISWRNFEKGRLLILLLIHAVLALFLGMIRGHQSALYLNDGISVARYMTLPSVLFVLSCLIMLKASIRSAFSSAKNRSRIELLLLFCMGVIHFQNDRIPISENSLQLAFPHDEKVRMFEEVKHVVESSGQGETLAIPGWTPIETMRLDIGGGRTCGFGENLQCIFGSTLNHLDSDCFNVFWLGTFKIEEGNWILHPEWGSVEVVGYVEGFYWFRRKSGELFLSGPAIYPRCFEYPLEKNNFGGFWHQK